MTEEILDEAFEEKENLILLKTSLTERLKSMVLDHIVMTMIISFFATIPIIISANKKILNSPLINQFSLSSLEIFFIAGFMAIYFMKDTLNGRSLGKRYFGQIVLDSKTKLPANETKCILRNITIPLWFLELLFTLISPSRRLGDYIAGTEIMKTNSIPFSKTKIELRNYDKLNFLIYWLITTFCIMGILFLL